MKAFVVVIFICAAVLLGGFLYVGLSDVQPKQQERVITLEIK
jgi:hypothetical protein